MRVWDSPFSWLHGHRIFRAWAGLLTRIVWQKLSSNTPWQMSRIFGSVPGAVYEIFPVCSQGTHEKIQKLIATVFALKSQSNVLWKNSTLMVAGYFEMFISFPVFLCSDRLRHVQALVQKMQNATPTADAVAWTSSSHLMYVNHFISCTVETRPCVNTTQATLWYGLAFSAWTSATLPNLSLFCTKNYT